MKRMLSVLLAICMLAVGGIGAAASSGYALVAGDFHAVALRPDNTVWTWGYNYAGQMGDGTRRDRPSPIIIPGLSDVTEVAAGYGHTIALKEDGTVWTWGDNRNGQLGLGDRRDRGIPTQVTRISDVTAVAANSGNSYALKSDGTVWGWGMAVDGSAYGQNMPVDTITPEQVDISGVVAIAAKNSQAFALKADGTVWGWGYDSNGSLGRGNSFLGNSTYHVTPAQVVGLTDVTKIVTGGYHTFAWKADGTIWAWGSNHAGQFGNGQFGATTQQSISVPMEVPELTDIAAIAAHNSYTILLKTDGTVWTCGHSDFRWWNNESGERIEPHYVPTKVPGLTDVVAVAAGLHFASAMQSDGTIWCWGDNEFGQLGDGTTFSSTNPVQILGATEVTIPEDYEETFYTDPYDVIGSDNITAASATPEITWNENEMRLEVAKGLPAGTYKATLAANDEEGNSAAKTVTVRVVKTIFSTRYESTIWNWFKFIVLFGWVWMWFA